MKMKPVKRWAIVRVDDGALLRHSMHQSCIYVDRRIALMHTGEGERIARVEIREVTK
jgi:hypothetical protein